MTRFIVAAAWLYVVILMAVAQAGSPDGGLLGAVVTFVLYGALPLGIVLYVLGSSARRARRRTAEPGATSTPDPDRGGHATGDAVTAKREEA